MNENNRKKERRGCLTHAPKHTRWGHRFSSTCSAAQVGEPTAWPLGNPGDAVPAYTNAAVPATFMLSGGATCGYALRNEVGVSSVHGHFLTQSGDPKSAVCGVIGSSSLNSALFVWQRRPATGRNDGVQLF